MLNALRRVISDASGTIGDNNSNNSNSNNNNNQQESHHHHQQQPPSSHQQEQQEQKQQHHHQQQQQQEGGFSFSFQQQQPPPPIPPSVVITATAIERGSSSNSNRNSNNNGGGGIHKADSLVEALVAPFSLDHHPLANNNNRSNHLSTSSSLSGSVSDSDSDSDDDNDNDNDGNNEHALNHRNNPRRITDDDEEEEEEEHDAPKEDKKRRTEFNTTTATATSITTSMDYMDPTRTMSMSTETELDPEDAPMADTTTNAAQVALSPTATSGGPVPSSYIAPSIPMARQQQQLQQQQQQQQQQPLHNISYNYNYMTNNNVIIHNTPIIYERMDSDTNNAAESSQTSSRDWGWFEDVHISGNEIATSLLHHHQGSGGNSSSRNYYLHQRGSVHRQDQDRNGGHGGRHRGGGDHDADDDDDHDDGDPQDDLVEPPQVVDEEAAAMAVTAPTYVLEESLSSQKLWKHTAGNRPPQPLEERAFYEKMWAQNFARSQVNYQMPVEVLTASAPLSLNPFADGVFEGVNSGTQMITDYNQFTPTGGAALTQPAHRQHHHNEVSPIVPDGDTRATTQILLSQMHDISAGDESNNKNYQKVPGSKSDGELTVLLRGPNAFGTTVSKSFARSSDNGSAIIGVDTVNISIASYRVVESKKYGKYAQFLVIYREGSIRDTVGVWKRYRDFETLSHKVVQAHEGCAAVIANMSPLAITEEPEIEHLPNAITSWRLLKKRKRWYRCLDAGYLSLKVFLLERFLHDILFESSSPKLLRDFVLGPDMDGPL